MFSNFVIMRLIDTFVRCAMKRIGLLALCLTFVLTGCQALAKATNITELSLKMDKFMDGGNQFEVTTTIDVLVDQNGNEESASESITAYAQQEPYYAIIETEDMMIVETMNENNINTYIMEKDNQVNGIQLYEFNQTMIEESNNPLSNLDINLNKVNVKKISSSNFEVSGRMIDFLPEDLVKDLKEILLESGATETEINGITLKLVFLFSEDAFTYSMTFDFDIQDVLLTIDLSVMFSYTEFELIDITDDTLYYPMSSYETEIPIDASKPILFTDDQARDTQYYTYLEAGKYGFKSEAYYGDLGLKIAITDASNDDKALLVFKDVYNEYNDNPLNISQFFDIKESGYYFINVHYPLSFAPYTLELERIEPLTDGTESIDLIVTESGTYDYQIESMYDFYSIQFDLESDAIIYLSVDGYSYVYKKDTVHDFYESIPITTTPLEYIYTSNAVLYLHDPVYSRSGEITVEIHPLVHSTSVDEPLLHMKETPNTDYLYSGNRYPNQYIKLEVTAALRYTFNMTATKGLVSNAKGNLLDINGKVISSIGNQSSLVLMPGTYYYETSNLESVTYSIYYETDEVGITKLAITSIGQTSEYVGMSLSEMPHLDITFQQKGDVVIGTFELLETKAVIFGSSQDYSLYDESGHPINLLGMSGAYFMYQLQAGKYMIKITHPTYLNSYSFPYDVLVPFAIFTGGTSDDSTYGNYQNIPFGLQGIVTKYDYLGDQDGVTFTLLETKTVTIFSNSDAYLYLGTQLIERHFEQITITLEAGTYTLISSGYPEDWQISVVLQPNLD